MRSLKVLAVVLFAAYILGWVIQIGTNIQLSRGGESIAKAAELRMLRMYASALLPLVVNVIIAIWLFIEGTRRKITAWPWALVGFVGGIAGAVLFFVFELDKKYVSMTD